MSLHAVYANKENADVNPRTPMNKRSNNKAPRLGDKENAIQKSKDITLSDAQAKHNHRYRTPLQYTRVPLGGKDQNALERTSKAAGVGRTLLSGTKTDRIAKTRKVKERLVFVEPLETEQAADTKVSSASPSNDDDNNLSDMEYAPPVSQPLKDFPIGFEEVNLSQLLNGSVDSSNRDLTGLPLDVETSDLLNGNGDGDELDQIIKKALDDDVVTEVESPKAISDDLPNRRIPKSFSGNRETGINGKSLQKLHTSRTGSAQSSSKFSGSNFMAPTKASLAKAANTSRTHSVSNSSLYSDQRIRTPRRDRSSRLDNSLGRLNKKSNRDLNRTFTHKDQPSPRISSEIDSYPPLDLCIPSVESSEDENEILDELERVLSPTL